jgi:hypothetical protein
MKKEELMIGDWYSWEAEGKKYYFQVTEETFSLLDDDVFNFQAVPLTPEIIEKNGFQHFQMNFSCCLWNVFEITSVLHIAICGEIIMFGYYLSDKDGNDTIIPLFNIRYVHQLQHALKLCEIEKTIEL